MAESCCREKQISDVISSMKIRINEVENQYNVLKEKDNSTHIQSLSSIINFTDEAKIVE